MFASLLFPSASQCPPSQFFHSRIATANLLVSVGQTTRQRINYFYVNEAISMIEYRAPTYYFQLAIVSFTAYCVFFTYYTFFWLRNWEPPKSWWPLAVSQSVSPFIRHWNQCFGEFCWHNKHIILHALPLIYVSWHWIWTISSVG